MARPFGSLGLRVTVLIGLLALPGMGRLLRADDAGAQIFHRDNLVAWCIVPFDAKRRGPEERAKMLARLGFKKFAYDWRAEHIPTFDAEISELKKQGVELTAWWFPANLNDEAKQILAALKRNQVRTQLWVTMGDPGGKDQTEKVANAVKQLLPVVEAAKAQDCTVGLYNHGGWFGEPENQLAIIAELKRDNVGIVYNLHHGHDHLGRFSELLEKMTPHLYALNLNGMVPGGDRQGQKILQLGQGERDLDLLKTIVASGYRGPIGILGHTQDDAEARLQDNLDGLAWLTKQLQGKPPGEKPKPRTPVPAATKTSSLPANPTAGWLIAGRPEYRTPPLTVECRVRCDQKGNYNILVASDTKASGNHWELFSMAGSGQLTAYLPGYQPDHVRSTAILADGKWHEAAIQFAAERVRLFLDGKEVANQAVKRTQSVGVAGELAIGRLVEGGIGHVGDIEWVRISAGASAVRQPQETPPATDEQTIGYWRLPETGAEAPDLSSAKNKARRVGQTPAPKPTTTNSSIPAIPPLPAEFDATLVKQLVASAQTQGNARRGIAVFHSAKFACLNCHQVGEHGGAVGPALSDVGKRLKPEEIAEALLWPKRTVKPEFSAWRYRLADGRTVQGYKRSETPDGIHFFDPATQKSESIAKQEIDEAREAGTLMPDGLANAMTNAQRRDVLRLLLELGNTTGLEQEVRPEEAPAAFAYDRAPLDRTAWKLWEHPVNRDRIYDFYRKEALHFRDVSHRPHLLPAFPGLDGGKLGHWGNQNEEVWKDGRWNQADLGNVLSGVTHLPGGAVSKGVCVQLGEQRELAACFNPETLTYDAVWHQGFLKFSEIRHGFMDGLRPSGEFLPRSKGEKPKQPFVYHGFYRIGKRVVFSYRLGEVELLDSPWAENGKFTRVVAPAEKHPLHAAIQNPPSQWPQEIQTTGELGGNDRSYAVDTIRLPFENPWKSLMFFGDHDFLPDGSALLCTMTGDVWRVSGLDEKLDNVRWRRFASGLHQPQGLVVSEGKIYVLGRDQITRLHDLNQDGEADFYECFSNAMPTSSGGHDFTCGLARDDEGRFYTASGKQGLIRISADGQSVEVLATGFRNPDGLGLCKDGAITVPCSEGDWTPASMLCLVRPGQTPVPHFGYQGPKDGEPPALPFVYLPRGLDNSSGGQTTVNDKRFGPLAEQILHFSFGAGTQFLVLRDEVAGQAQGAVVPLPFEFRSGAHRGKVNPKDGQLYVSGMAGWGSYTPDDGCFHRVRYTGKPVQLPQAFHLHENGVRIRFAEAVDPNQLGKLHRHFAQVWNYRYSPGYGSPELAPSHPGVVGHEALEIAGVHCIDERTLFVELPDLQPVNQLHLLLQVDSGTAQELFITAHKLDKPFTAFPGYHPSEKTIAAHPQAIDLALLGKQIPNPWRKRMRMPPTANLEIAAGKNLTFSTRILKAKSGESVQLTFTNPDVVPHNWVLLKPGSLATVGDLANKLIADPEAVLKQYVPASDDVIAYTDIVPPQQQFSIYFQAPKAKGRYPYLCTFPGHWMVMNGELVVE
jgi:putative heme-binding domain-containing protein